MRLGRSLRYCHRLVVTRPVKATVLILMAAYAGATAVIATEDDISFGEAAVRGLPAFLGELGAPTSRSWAVRVAILVSLCLSVAFLAVLTAWITTVFVEFCRRGGRIMNKTRVSKHVIVCGWNLQGPSIVSELLTSDVHKEIVILTDLDQHPLREDQKSHRVDFVRGDPTQDEDLRKAGVERADSVIVLTDFTKDANAADARALMIVLAVESINRAVHTCVQILNSANRMHLQRAHADEIVCLDRMGGNLVVASAVNHGVSRVVQELLTFNEGSEFYRCDWPFANPVKDTEFSTVAHRLARQRVVLLGFETDHDEELRSRLPHDVIHVVSANGDAGAGGDGEGDEDAKRRERAVVVNPQGSYSIREGDALFVIAESKPTRI